MQDSEEYNVAGVMASRDLLTMIDAVSTDRGRVNTAGIGLKGGLNVEVHNSRRSLYRLHHMSV